MGNSAGAALHGGVILQAPAFQPQAPNTASGTPISTVAGVPISAAGVPISSAGKPITGTNQVNTAP